MFVVLVPVACAHTQLSASLAKAMDAQFQTEVGRPVPSAVLQALISSATTLRALVALIEKPAVGMLASDHTRDGFTPAHVHTYSHRALHHQVAPRVLALGTLPCPLMGKSTTGTRRPAL